MRSRAGFLLKIAMPLSQAGLCPSTACVVAGNYAIPSAGYRSPRPPLLSSFISVSALLPTLAIAASISGFDFLRCLHQYRASSLLEISTRFLALFRDEVVSMTGGPFGSPDKRRIVILFPQTDRRNEEGPAGVVAHSRAPKLRCVK
jgi:hypothetical protein